MCWHTRHAQWLEVSGNYTWTQAAVVTLIRNITCYLLTDLPVVCYVVLVLLLCRRRMARILTLALRWQLRMFTVYKETMLAMCALVPDASISLSMPDQRMCQHLACRLTSKFVLLMSIITSIPSILWRSTHAHPTPAICDLQGPVWFNMWYKLKPKSGSH